jgi:hypothetical protein
MSGESVSVEHDELYDVVFAVAVSLLARRGRVEVPVSTLMWMRDIVDGSKAFGRQSARYFVRCIDGFLSDNNGEG